MPRLADLAGRQFGYLKALYLLDERKNGKPVWMCRCQCGREKGIVGTNLTNWEHPTRTCGHRDCDFRKKATKEKVVKEKRPPVLVYPMEMTKPCRNCGTPVTRTCWNYNQRVPGYYCNKVCQDAARAATWAKKIEPHRRITKHKKPYQKAHKVKMTKKEIEREKVLALKKRDEEYRQALRCHKLQEVGLWK